MERPAVCKAIRRSPTLSALLLFAFAFLPSSIPAQTIRFEDGTALSAAQAQHVTFTAEPAILKADQPDWLELHFHIEPGYHINSHTPTDQLLIPTTLKLAASPAVRVLDDAYPHGTPLQLHIGVGETLSAYTGEVLIRVHVVARRGDSTLLGTLHYQACDAGSCFPPHDLPIRFPLTAR